MGVQQVLAGAFGAAADCDHQRLDAGLAHSIKDAIALAGVAKT